MTPWDIRQIGFVIPVFVVLYLNSQPIDLYVMRRLPLLANITMISMIASKSKYETFFILYYLSTISCFVLTLCCINTASLGFAKVKSPSTCNETTPMTNLQPQLTRLKNLIEESQNGYVILFIVSMQHNSPYIGITKEFLFTYSTRVFKLSSYLRKKELMFQP